MWSRLSMHSAVRLLSPARAPAPLREHARACAARAAGAKVTPESIVREWTPGSRRVGAVGMKCGMSQAWSATGERVPLTVIEIQDLQVFKVRTPMTDGVCALQLAGGWEKRKRLSFSAARQYESKGLAYKRYMREFPVTEDALLPIGTTISAQHFTPGQFVDVQATTRGKGFQGVVKRWGFAGQSASHGTTKAERKPGSMGGSAGSMYGTKISKGKKMPGRMGNNRRTVKGLMVWKVEPKYNLIYCKGSIPGSKGIEVRIRDSVCLKQEHFVKHTPPPFPTCLPGHPHYEDDGEALLCPAASDPSLHLVTGLPPFSKR